MTEQGAAADNACREWSARRRRALRTGPRAPGPPLPSSNWVPEAWREKAGGSQRWPKGGFANLPAPPGAPFPLFGEEGKQGPRARPGARNQTHGTAERWLLDNAAAMSCRSQRRDRCMRPGAMALWSEKNSKMAPPPIIISPFLSPKKDGDHFEIGENSKWRQLTQIFLVEFEMASFLDWKNSKWRNKWD